MIGIDILLAVHLSIWCGVDITIFVYTNRKTFDWSWSFRSGEDVDKVVDPLMGKRRKNWFSVGEAFTNFSWLSGRENYRCILLCQVAVSCAFDEHLFSGNPTWNPLKMHTFNEFKHRTLVFNSLLFFSDSVAWSRGPSFSPIRFLVFWVPGGW